MQPNSEPPRLLCRLCVLANFGNTRFWSIELDHPTESAGSKRSEAEIHCGILQVCHWWKAGARVLPSQQDALQVFMLDKGVLQVGGARKAKRKVCSSEQREGHVPCVHRCVTVSCREAPLSAMFDHRQLMQQ